MAACQPRLILASTSPRRRHLLAILGLPFTIRPAQVNEEPRPGEPGGKLAHRLARAKALAVASRLRRPGWVLGADTVVILQGRILGKPRDEHHARSMLEDLSGRLHRAITALVLEPARIPGAHALSGLSTTQVRFAPLPAARISWLMASGEHRDKAGAYAVQGRAACFITELRGSYTNVVGLPLDLLFNMLETIGFFRPRRSER